MYNRSSVVPIVKVNDTSSSSIVQIGDSVNLAPRADVFAVQRELPIYYGREADDLSPFPIYTQPIPEPIIDEPIKITTYHENPIIHVRSIGVVGIGASGILHIGSTRSVNCEARVKNIRQFLKEPE
ncbi:spore germination protein GerPE [Pseudalkalibacillus caeni]|uniref:Spore germination protein GerPE n=1 Tax=Exobacillus caeni TaxID=2574798 RepID=A0A5R9FAM3_9BACL|nr:spore germination protein GerPE [Pseudalkalibacillus caeni]TLS37923.1 spore germination protein GerPE [Pseudalkalibacillus caeni]